MIFNPKFNFLIKIVGKSEYLRDYYKNREMQIFRKICIYLLFSRVCLARFTSIGVWNFQNIGIFFFKRHLVYLFLISFKKIFPNIVDGLYFCILFEENSINYYKNHYSHEQNVHSNLLFCHIFILRGISNFKFQSEPSGQNLDESVQNIMHKNL